MSETAPSTLLLSGEPSRRTRGRTMLAPALRASRIYPAEALRYE